MNNLIDLPSFEPGRSPWQRILVHFEFIDQFYPSRLAVYFRPLRDFIVAAGSSPCLDDRYVYPSTINMWIFKTGFPVVNSDAYLHLRVVVSPRQHGKIRVRKFAAGQKDDPEAEWICDPLEA